MKKVFARKLNLFYFIFFSIHYVKRPGAVLDSGSVVANLQLDDPTRVVQVSIYLFQYSLCEETWSSARLWQCGCQSTAR